MPHKPVLLKETISQLNLMPGMTVVDGTIGAGGHASEILKAIGAHGRLIGLDQDPQAIVICAQKFESFKQASFHQENFRNLDSILDRLNIDSVDAVILDVGFSSVQLEDATRGFSFEREGPLDMRMNPASPVTARGLVYDLSQKELEKIFRELGEERWSQRIAEAICNRRLEFPIQTTTDLAELIRQAVPRMKFHRKKTQQRLRLNPATRVFQALRIAVNDELGALNEGLPKIWRRLRSGGRIAVITFHSLEDRIIKNQFRNWCDCDEGRLVTRKPLTPSRAEIIENRRSRSAKLRVAEKI